MKMLQSASLTFVFTVLLLFSTSLFSQAEWTALSGPEGGKITAIQLDSENPNVILVATDGGGVFQSFNRGVDWHPKNQGLTNLHVHSLAFTPFEPKIVYCGTKEGLFFSEDFGESWTATSFDSLQINAIQFHPSKAGYIFVATNHGLFRTVDQGESWLRIAEGIPSDPFYTIMLHAGDDHSLLVGTNNGVYLSYDLGDTWDSHGLQGNVVQTLSMHPNSQRTMYAGTRDNGVFRNMTSGKTWESLSQGVSARNIQQLLNDPDDSGTVYAVSADAGIFKSTNRGDYWTRLNDGLSLNSAFSICLNPLNTQEVWTGTVNGVYFSSNGGEMWQRTSGGLVATQINQVVINSQNPHSLYGGTLSGVRRSYDRGLNWQANENELMNCEVTALVMSPVDTNIVWAGTTKKGVFRSIDAGQTWHKMSADFTVRQICLDPQDSLNVYLLTEQGIVKSADFGLSWQEKNTGLPSARVNTLELSQHNSFELFAGIEGHGVYKSANAGERWYALNYGIENQTVLSLMQNFQQARELLLAGTNSGLFKSTDSGASWEPDGFVPEPVVKLVSCPTNPSLIYGATKNRNVILSTDRSETWQVISDPEQFEAISLAVDPFTSGLVYAGSFGKGIFQYRSLVPQISVPLLRLEFGDVRVDSTKTLEIQIQNTGSTELQIQQILIDSEVFQLENRQYAVPPSSEISVSLAFSPDSKQNYETDLEIWSNDPDRPVLRIPVAGRGIAPELSVSDELIEFGPVRLHQQQQRTLVVSNSGSAPLRINALELNSTAFQVENRRFSLNPNESREIVLRFAPSDTGWYQDSLFVRSSVREQLILLDGYGVQPQLEVAGQLIDFGETTVNQPIKRTIEVSNSGNATLNFTKIAVANPEIFKLVEPPDSIAAFSKLLFEMAFLPPDSGVFADSLVIESDGGKDTIMLAGKAILPPYRLSANALDFGNMRVDQTTAPRRLFLKNQGKLSVKLNQVAVRSPEIFRVTFDDSVIQAQDSLEIQLRFRPNAVKSFADTLRLSSDFWDVRVPLSGHGIAPQIEFSPKKLVFPRIKVGRHHEQQLTIFNSGNDTLRISEMMTQQPEFEVTFNSSKLAPGEQSDVIVFFHPAAGIEYQDTLKILSDWDTVSIPLTGEGELIRLALSDTVLSFGQRLILSPCFEQLYLFNRGSHDLTINAMTLKNGNAFEVSPSQAVIPVGDSLKAMITFLPEENMVFQDTLQIRFAEDEFRALPLSGIGMVASDGPHLVIYPDSLEFQRTGLNETAAQTIHFSNAGGGKLILTQPGSMNDVFRFGSFPAILDSGQSIETQVLFQPDSRKIYQEKIYIASNANTDSIVVHGVGVAPDLMVRDSLLAFPNTPVDSANVKTFILRNAGNDTLLISSVSATPDEFQAEPKQGRLNEGDSLAIRLQFSPKNTGVFKGLVTILSNDPENPRYEIQINGASYGPDRSGPIILHSPNLIATVNQPIPLSAQISDENSGIASALLCFRNGGDAEFAESRDITSGTIQIPAAFANTRGIEYFILATDNAGNQTRIPPESNFSISVFTEGQGDYQRDNLDHPVPLPHGSAQTAYHLLSIPLLLDNPHPLDVLKDEFGRYDESRWIFADYQPETGDSDGFVYLSDEKKISDFIPGKAFWILSSEPDIVVKSGRGRSLPSNETFLIPLHSGWNLIGNPYNFAIDAAQLQLKSGNELTLFTYRSQWDTAKTLVPWEGYAVFNFQKFSDTLSVYPQTELLPELGKRNPAEDIDWRLNLAAICETARDDFNWIGTSQQARGDWDYLDQPEPPGVGEYVSLYFPHSEWELPTDCFTSDFKPSEANGNVWEFTVVTNIQNSKVRLKFNGLQNLPVDYQVVLRDQQTLVTKDITAESDYEYAVFGGETARNFELMVGSGDWLSGQRDLIPGAFELSPAFPNPALIGTMIRYALPRDAEVTLTVYNITGQQIRSLILEKWHQPGHHVVEWDGRNEAGQRVANGVYFYKLQTPVFQQTRKVLILH